MSGSESCTSSCESDCHLSGHSSDSGVHQEPFYLHPPNGATPPDPPAQENGKQKDKNGFFLNPLNDLKEASEKYSKSKAEAGKEGDKKSKKPFFLHKPEAVSYHRVQELFVGKSSKTKEGKKSKAAKENGIKDAKKNGKVDHEKENAACVACESHPESEENGKPHSGEKKGRVDYEGRKLPKIPSSSSASSFPSSSSPSNSSSSRAHHSTMKGKLGIIFSSHFWSSSSVSSCFYSFVPCLSYSRCECVFLCL